MWFVCALVFFQNNRIVTFDLMDAMYKNPWQYEGSDDSTGYIPVYKNSSVDWSPVHVFPISTVLFVQ